MSETTASCWNLLVCHAVTKVVSKVDLARASGIYQTLLVRGAQMQASQVRNPCRSSRKQMLPRKSAQHAMPTKWKPMQGNHGSKDRG